MSLAVSDLRSKIRTCVHGVRVWIYPADKSAFELAMKIKRGKRQKWTPRAWSKIVKEAVRNDWCGLKHGGPRRKQDAKEAMAAESGLHPAPEEGGVASNADSCACGLEFNGNINVNGQRDENVLLPAPEQTLASALSFATGGVAEEAVHTSRRSEDVRHGEEFADLVAAAGAADVEHEATRHQKKQRSVHLKDVDVLEELGSGSFGCVFRCRVQDTEYAVKVKHRVCSQGTADKEVAILKHLAQDKPNRFIVQLLAWRKNGDRQVFLFFPHEWSDLSKELQKHWEADTHFSYRDVSSLARGLCSGLAFAHDKCVLHRDLKPSNILLRRACGCVLEPRICDFGNACVLSGHSHFSAAVLSPAAFGGDSLTAMTRDVTTLWYAAPEMLMPRLPYSFPIDVWALGVIFATIEQGRHITATAPGAASSEQLLHLLRICNDQAASAFCNSAKQCQILS